MPVISMSAMSFTLLRLFGHCPVFLGMGSVSVLLVQLRELPVHGCLQRLRDLEPFLEEGRQILKILVGHRSPAEELGRGLRAEAPGEPYCDVVRRLADSLVHVLKPLVGIGCP